MDKPTPRINSALREKYRGRVVRLIGKLVSLTGMVAVLEATDHGQVMVELNGQNTWGTDYVEVIGLVEPDFRLKEFKTHNLGNSFNLDLADKFVVYSQQFPEMFDGA